MTMFNVLIEQDKDGIFISEVIGLLECRMQAKTIDELIKRTRAAISAYLQSDNDFTLEKKFIGIKKIKVS